MKLTFAILLIFALSINALEVLDEFDMGMEENGARFKQRVQVNRKNGLIITDVPAHNDILANLNVLDSANSGLQLRVLWRDRQCQIYKPAIGFITAEDQLKVAAEAVWPENGYLSITRAKNVDLWDILGPELFHSELPQIFKPYCPKDFTVFTARQVIQNDNVTESFYSDEPFTPRRQENNATNFIFKDPSLRDESDQYSLSQFAYMPQSVVDRLTHHHRQKRDCQTTDGRNVPNCHVVNTVTCGPGGNACRFFDLAYDCKSSNRARSCQYTLLCTREGRVDQAGCILHARNSQNRCTMCCYGRHSCSIPTCSNTN